ncbi:hypothetical protein GCK72_011794 [Caenorhabditis remanei]|uniref:Sdz-33 F-box domain-containing protein n=1 Tax=Caenorhabditis remanei TaxID=31234 RepID=A0A6A5H716_CAERE|nr:hypothetical protein GCK72_011794 [Caenorhabditis remanei]KAF1763528.1 hypothetical protein GCK72_011794 [Caenorhabditis remanei]
MEKVLSMVPEVKVLDVEREVDPKIFEFVMNNVKVMRNFTKHYDQGPVVPEPFSTQLHCTDSILSRGCEWTLPDILLKLNCRHSVFEYHKFVTADLMAFLKKWMSSEGEEMKNIEYLMIAKGTKFDDMAEIEYLKKELGVVRCDQSRGDRE